MSQLVTGDDRRQRQRLPLPTSLSTTSLVHTLSSASVALEMTTRDAGG